MASSPLILAALAKAALPTAKFKQARSIPREIGSPIESALLTDSEGIQYVVRASRNAQGDLTLATETSGSRAVKNAGHLSFRVPTLVAESSTPKGHALQVLEFVYGSNVELDQLRATDPILRSVGLAIAEIHSLNVETIKQAGLPEFTSGEVRDARILELDRAAATGQIPAALLQRWESALEDLDLFRFKSTVVHGNLTSGTVLELDYEVSGILGWSNLHVGDPAEDFVSFAANIDSDPLDAVKFAYFERREDLDSNLAQRATLYSELAVANYLVGSLKNDNQDDVAWAISELEAIAASVEDGSARPLSTMTFSATTPLLVESEKFLVVEDDHTVVTEIDETIDVSDLKTRPIELPEKGDDQLF